MNVMLIVLGLLPAILVLLDALHYGARHYISWLNKKKFVGVSIGWKVTKKWYEKNHEWRFDSSDFWMYYFWIFGVMGTILTCIIAFLMSHVIVLAIWCLAIFSIFLIGSLILRALITICKSIKQLSKVAHSHSKEGEVVNLEVDTDILTKEELKLFESIKKKATK